MVAKERGRQRGGGSAGAGAGVTEARRLPTGQSARQSLSLCLPTLAFPALRAHPRPLSAALITSGRSFLKRMLQRKAVSRRSRLGLDEMRTFHSGPPRFSGPFLS